MIPGRRATMPQIDPKEHNAGTACASCHTVHGVEPEKTAEAAKPEAKQPAPAPKSGPPKESEHKEGHEEHEEEAH